MSEQPPEIVAAANLSPLPPSPIQLHNTSPTLIPKLQDHAAALDISTLEPPHLGLAPQAAFAMDPETGSAEPSDTIVVAGDYTDESQDESDDSFDAYGEDEDGEEQNKNEPDAVNDDYAQTFDSPTGQSEAGESQPDVSEAAESMNSSSAPDSMKNQSPSAPTSVLLSSPQPLGMPATLGLAQPPSAPSEQAASESHSAPQSGASTPAAAPAASSASSTASPSQAPDAPASETLPDAPASDGAAAPVPAAENEDDGAVDIQKLVDSITARAAASAAPALPPAQATPVTSPNVSTTLNISPSASLPPKPSISHQQHSHLPAIPQAHSFQPRNSNSVPSPVASQPPTHPASQRGPYLSAGPPGTANDGFSSLPPPPPSSFGGVHAHSHAPQAGSHHISQSPAIQQAWETFLVDEKRYTSEAKWDRFPEGSRIFIGNLSSERVSKREVFEAFHKFGRLAQISLKNAYGFVQYHTAGEGLAAMQGAQGAEMGGRKIRTFGRMSLS
jgi:nuclear polyadenylated RNA-binding protein 3